MSEQDNGVRSETKRSETFARVVRRFYKGRKLDETKQEDIVETRMLPEGVNPAGVRLKYGLTLNLGDYESARIDMEWYVPCLPEEIEDVHEYIDRSLTERMEQEVLAIRGGKTNG